MSQNITGLSPWNFLTAGTRLNPSVGEWGTAPQVGGHYEKITLQEIINGIQTGSGGGTANMNPLGAMGDNLRSNLLPMIFSLAGVKIAGKVITKLGVSRQFNSLARSTGLGTMVRM
jgi:hypothetical protein